jgi:transcriptional regulator with XRE-family HTH domain
VDELGPDSLPAFAEKLRQLRHERDLSLRELATLAHYGKSYIQEIESGRKPATAAIAWRLDEALGANGHLARLADRAADEETTPSLAPINLAPAASAEPMGDDDILRLHDTVQHLVALDTMHGSDGLYSNAVRAFRNAHRKLSTVGARPGLRGDVHAAVAEVGEVAAWLSYDSEHHDVSRQVAGEAMLVAQLGGDTNMYRFLVSHLSMQASYLGRGAESLELANRVMAETPKSKRVVGMMRVRRARALGRLGDGTAALAELGRAKGSLAGGIGPEDPAWSWWLHAAELAVHEARIKAGTGDAPGAVWASEQSVLQLPAGQGRDQALYRAWLISDLINVRAWREASEVAEQLIEKAPVVGSARVPRILLKADRRASRAGAPGWLTEALREAAEAADPAV